MTGRFRPDISPYSSKPHLFRRPHMSHADAPAFTPWDNPMGTDGFEFIEYAAPDPVAMGKVFERMGFTAVAKHRHKNVLLYRQGTINFILNAEPDSFAQKF